MPEFHPFELIFFVEPKIIFIILMENGIIEFFWIFRFLIIFLKFKIFSNKTTITHNSNKKKAHKFVHIWWSETEHMSICIWATGLSQTNWLIALAFIILFPSYHSLTVSQHKQQQNSSKNHIAIYTKFVRMYLCNVTYTSIQGSNQYLQLQTKM